jgi:hypothetical protein
MQYRNRTKNRGDGCKPMIATNDVILISLTSDFTAALTSNDVAKVIDLSSQFFRDSTLTSEPPLVTENIVLEK